MVDVVVLLAGKKLGGQPAKGAGVPLDVGGVLLEAGTVAVEDEVNVAEPLDVTLKLVVEQNVGLGDKDGDAHCEERGSLLDRVVPERCADALTDGEKATLAVDAKEGVHVGREVMDGGVKAALADGKLMLARLEPLMLRLPLLVDDTLGDPDTLSQTLLTVAVTHAVEEPLLVSSSDALDIRLGDALSEGLGDAFHELLTDALVLSKAADSARASLFLLATPPTSRRIRGDEALSSLGGGVQQEEETVG